jgi:hypothetical protein
VQALQLCQCRTDDSIGAVISAPSCFIRLDPLEVCSYSLNRLNRPKTTTFSENWGNILRRP